jgi:hypothetical protein
MNSIKCVHHWFISYCALAIVLKCAQASCACCNLCSLRAEEVGMVSTMLCHAGCFADYQLLSAFYLPALLGLQDYH